MAVINRIIIKTSFTIKMFSERHIRAEHLMKNNENMRPLKASITVWIRSTIYDNLK